MRKSEREKGIKETGKGKKQKKNKRNDRQVETKSASGFQLSRLFSDLSARRMVAAGLIAGTLPLVHAHSFIVVMVVGVALALWQRRWRDWILFFLFASVVAVPQMWWSTHNSAVDAKTFFEWHFGWDRGTENTVWFWLKNTGIFIPLIALALLWRGKNYLVSKRLLNLLLAIHALLHRSEFGQTGALGVGQYQGALLLVACIGATCSTVARPALATARTETRSRTRVVCTCHICGQS